MLPFSFLPNVLIPSSVTIALLSIESGQSPAPGRVQSVPSVRCAPAAAAPGLPKELSRQPPLLSAELYDQ